MGRDTKSVVTELAEPYRDLWDERLDRLDAHLRRMQEQPTGDDVTTTERHDHG